MACGYGAQRSWLFVQTATDGPSRRSLAPDESMSRVRESGLVPLDAQMAAEFEDRGASFVVRSTVDELE
jgi:hypothetical protein